METNPRTLELDVVYNQLDKGSLELYASNSLQEFEGKSQVVALILYKNKSEKISRSEPEDEKNKNHKNRISIYYGESPCCKECSYYCDGYNRPVDVIAIMGCIFSLLLIIFSVGWIIASSLVLCKKWQGPGLTNDWEDEDHENKGFNNNVRSDYVQQISDRNVAANLGESNDFQTETFSTGNSNMK
jgi:hypothetical protein